MSDDDGDTMSDRRRKQLRRRLDRALSEIAAEQKDRHPADTIEPPHPLTGPRLQKLHKLGSTAFEAVLDIAVQIGRETQASDLPRLDDAEFRDIVWVSNTLMGQWARADFHGTSPPRYSVALESLLDRHVDIQRRIFALSGTEPDGASFVVT